MDSRMDTLKDIAFLEQMHIQARGFRKDDLKKSFGQALKECNVRSKAGVLDR